MLEQVARSTVERQLRSARREVRRKEEVYISEAVSGPALEAERTNNINDVVFKEVPQLRERMVARVGRIVEIAAKSNNLKGDLVRAQGTEIVENLAERCLDGDEGRRLERDNIRLREIMPKRTKI
ncbi:unnamed protein product [Pieris macdunnoughi]|uniref:Uncharacterized protein n=1 Tax=Pieris macdunnoughi TaxID=345717 RepID=A0A821UGC3_9NEOP|nr:unnamed protein product [Pieris macdunnoughi]